MGEAFFRTLHMLGILGLAAGVIIAIMATRPSLARDDVTGLSKVYIMSLIALLITTVAGLSLWFWVGKPADFFTNNPVFQAKMGLFVILAGLIGWPAAVFHRLASRMPEELQEANIPPTIQRLQKSAIPLLLVLPILAYLMARGIGY
tara:strand:- start:25709 stop:26149 length:441 start_codon:yes stop_codon:yes gene_type:complete